MQDQNFTTRDPVVAWNGADVGVVWFDEGEDAPRVMFTRFDAAGDKPRQDSLLSSEPISELIRLGLVANDDGWGAVWAIAVRPDRVRQQVRMQSVNLAGVRRGNDIHIGLDAITPWGAVISWAAEEHLIMHAYGGPGLPTSRRDRLGGSRQSWSVTTALVGTGGPALQGSALGHVAAWISPQGELHGAVMPLEGAGSADPAETWHIEPVGAPSTPPAIAVHAATQTFAVAWFEAPADGAGRAPLHVDVGPVRCR